jgi:hypothetical protein
MERGNEPLSTFLFVMEIIGEKWSHRGWFLVVRVFITKTCGSGLPDWRSISGNFLQTSSHY